MAFAIRDINADNYRTFRTWLRWGQARSLDELVAAQREEASIPWVNTVAVGRGSAYDLYLTRELKSAVLVRVPTSPEVVDELASLLDDATRIALVAGASAEWSSLCRPITR